MWDFADIYKKDQFAFSYCTVHELMYKVLEGRKLRNFFEWNNYDSYALFGLSSLGLLFLEYARKEGLEPSFAIDNRSPKVFITTGLTVVPLEKAIEHVEQVDIVVVCTVYQFNSVADSLEEEGIPASKIVSLNDIVFSI